MKRGEVISATASWLEEPLILQPTLLIFCDNQPMAAGHRLLMTSWKNLKKTEEETLFLLDRAVSWCLSRWGKRVVIKLNAYFKRTPQVVTMQEARLIELARLHWLSDSPFPLHYVKARLETNKGLS